MSLPVDAPPLSGNVLGPADGAFVIAEWKDAGGPPGPPRLIAPPHIHHLDNEAWYVLEGVLRVRINQDEFEARAGSCVFAPKGAKHTFWNPGPGPVRYLLIMTPKIFDLIQEIHSLKDRSPSALRTAFEKYDSEFCEN